MLLKLAIMHINGLVTDNDYWIRCSRDPVVISRRTYWSEVRNLPGYPILKQTRTKRARDGERVCACTGSAA